MTERVSVPRELTEDELLALSIDYAKERQYKWMALAILIAAYNAIAWYGVTK
jgi:hypothetical protein